MSDQEASFVITKVEGEAEPLTSTRKQMVDNLKGMTPGKPVLGVIGNKNLEPEPEPVGEQLTEKEKAHKRELIAFLLKYLDPPEMGTKFKPEQTRLILRKKVEKQTLGELRRFWSGKIPSSDDDIPDDKKEEMRRKWTDLSP